MSEVIRHHDSHQTHRGWAVSIFVGIMVTCLLGFVAGYPKGALRVSNAAQAEFAGSVTLGSEPILGTKKPVRYEAVIAIGSGTGQELNLKNELVQIATFGSTVSKSASDQFLNRSRRGAILHCAHS
jgi:hypothetical protein